MIGVITLNTPKADGQLWELDCGIKEGVPLLLIHGYPNPARRLAVLPYEIRNQRVVEWTEQNILRFLNSLA